MENCLRQFSITQVIFHWFTRSRGWSEDEKKMGLYILLPFFSSPKARECVPPPF